MMKYIIIIACIIAINTFTLSLVAQKDCEITYVANQGFILESNNKKIIIDGLFNKIDGNWCHSPSDEILKKINNSEYPFNEIDVIAITHVHRDHFNRDIVSNYMLNNSETLILCPKQVEQDLEKTKDYHKFKNRVTSITPDINTDTNIILAGIPIRVMRLEHSHYPIADTVLGEMVNKHRDIENSGYFFDLNGIKIFHCGDTNPLNEEEYSTYNLVEDVVDIAFLERLFMSYGEESINIMNKYINPDHIVLMHIAPDNISLFTEHFNGNKNITIFEEKMTTLNLILN
jgi:L-ascorbate metabolism protein UlaG (beta-lactamase superfamily)